MDGEDAASALRRPFGRPSRGLSGTLLVPFWGLSSVHSRTFASVVLWQGASSRPRSREKTGTAHNVSIVSFKLAVLTVIIVMCGFSLCPLNPEESHTKKTKNVK